jgi:hypothetical protein
MNSNMAKGLCWSDSEWSSVGKRINSDTRGKIVFVCTTWLRNFIEQFLCKKLNTFCKHWLLQLNPNKVKNGDVKVDSKKKRVVLNLDGVIGNLVYG